ncbi:MAG: hypothetical protein LBO63_03050 [Oscillospiraceae bacterium]|jgi:hypothetical protein|nr:hypothetical protein [Oscillospiraceae bacterium]
MSARRHPARRSSAVRSNEQKIPAIVIIAVIFLFGVFVKIAFPHFSTAVEDKITNVVDYKTAFSIIGEGVSGERDFGQSLRDAWTAAFTPDRDAVPAGNFGVAAPDSGDPSPSPTPENEAPAAGDLSKAIIDAYLSGAGEGVPAGSFYDFSLGAV